MAINANSMAHFDNIISFWGRILHCVIPKDMDIICFLCLGQRVYVDEQNITIERTNQIRNPGVSQQRFLL